MSFTLNIAAHELQAHGRVVRSLQANPTFDDVRPFVPEIAQAGAGAPSPRALYVCGSRDDVHRACEAGCTAVFAGPPDTGAPAGAALSVLGSAGMPVVLDALLGIAHRFGEWERAMDRISLSGGTLQELMDASETFLLNNVVVLDPALKLLAYTKNVPCDDPITVELIDHGYHTEDNIRKFKLNRRFKSWAESEGFVVNDTRLICKYVTVVKSFKTHSAFSLITVMMCNRADPDDYLLDVFGMFVERVKVYAQRDYPDDKPSGSAVDTFLRDLICGEIEGADAVVERSRFVGIPHDARFCLFYLKVGEDSVPSSRLLSDVSLAVAPAKTLIVEGAVVVLCFNCLSDECALHCLAGACPHERKTVSQRLNELLERYDLTCGRSSKYTDLENTPVAFEQAREAYAISRKKRAGAAGAHSVNSWERIFSFDAYGVDYLVDQLSASGTEMLDSTYVGSILATLARQDAEAKTNNYEFLHAYLVHERRASVVAEQLHMHRNNVNYRISRIEEQFGINTDDARLRQDLLLAYRLRDAWQS